MTWRALSKQILPAMSPLHFEPSFLVSIGSLGRGAYTAYLAYSAYSAYSTYTAYAV
jgi:hypothetical protein